MLRKNEKLLTIKEAADLFRVSRHTIQAWISPSSPNHRPEFARLVRHAGRKTVFLENEILEWLNQRRGPLYSVEYGERSPYWKERFVKGRGLLEASLNLSDRIPEPLGGFEEGLLGLDVEPLLIWLANGKNSSRILKVVDRAEGLILPIPLAYWILRRAAKLPKKIKEVESFLLHDGIFELASFDEESLKRTIEVAGNVPEINSENYGCCVAKGANAVLTCNKSLLKIPGLPVIAP